MSDHYLSFIRGDRNVALPPPVLLAPLSGVTDLPMRRIAMRCGASAVVSEMVAAVGFTQGHEETRLRAEGTGVSPHIVQLAGCHPPAMAEAARLAVASGADVIDINMGCPAKTVTGGAAGSALMREPDHAVRILAAVREAVDVPVTLKMRLGWDETSLNAPELGRRAESLGYDALVVHGRTRQQFYRGKADWPAIRRVVEAVRIPVIANGDVGDAMDARTCLAASGAAGVMIGRAALGRPWLVGEIAAALAGLPVQARGPAERSALALEHYDGLLAHHGHAIGVRHARKHLAAYLDHAGPGALPLYERTMLLTTTDPGLARDLLAKAFLGPDNSTAARLGQAA